MLGAGGATGYAAVQIGKLLGARVIGSASDEAKRNLAIAGGADAVEMKEGAKASRTIGSELRVMGVISSTATGSYT